MRRERKDRENYWRSVLDRQAESGQSVASFCRQESLSAASFYAWRRKLKGRDVADGPQLVPVQIAPVPTSAPVRIYLPDGVAIDAPLTIDASALASLVKVLGEADRC